MNQLTIILLVLLSSTSVWSQGQQGFYVFGDYFHGQTQNQLTLCEAGRRGFSYRTASDASRRSDEAILEYYHNGVLQWQVDSPSMGNQPVLHPTQTGTYRLVIFHRNVPAWRGELTFTVVEDFNVALNQAAVCDNELVVTSNSSWGTVPFVGYYYNNTAELLDGSLNVVQRVNFLPGASAVFDMDNMPSGIYAVNTVSNIRGTICSNTSYCPIRWENPCQVSGNGGTLSRGGVIIEGQGQEEVKPKKLQDSQINTKVGNLVENKEVFKVYPNPTRGTLTIEGSKGNLLVVNQLGQTVRTHVNEEGGTITVDLGGLPAGVYLLQNQSKTVKVVKQ